MSSETFLRLPEEKRNRFLDAAWEEFTRVRFTEVSINQIVRKAGIPRGSFYQYFLDKEDLLCYLLDQMRANIRRLYQDALDKAEGDVFRTQLLCFDGLIAMESLEKDPMLGRCIRFLQVNQGVDLQNLTCTQPGQMLLDGIWDRLDLRWFRRQDREYVFNVFVLLMGALGGAFMDVLCQKKDRDVSREALVLRLEIIRGGCLTPDAGPVEKER